MDSAAASGTTPLVQAQDTTAGTGQDGRRTPLRRWTTAKTQTMRVTISVPATASASAGHASPWDAVLPAVRLIVWWIPLGPFRPGAAWWLTRLLAVAWLTGGPDTPGRRADITTRCCSAGDPRDA